jgi:glycosyltransferase involved in cell wall biosynthesis
MIERMQILVILPFMPYPPLDGGKIRAFMFLRHLSREFDIHLLTFIEKADEGKHAHELKKIFKEVDTVLRIPSPLPLRLKLLFPVHFWGYYSDAMRDKLIEILRTRAIDVVHIKSTQMFHYIEFIKRLPVILTEFDAGIFSIKKSYVRPNKGLRRTLDYVSFLQVHRWMKYYAKKIYKIIAVTDSDKKKLALFRAEDDIEVVNTGVDIEYFSSGYEEVKENRLVFVGSMNHYPNVDAMLYFYNEIFPLIKAEIADVKLMIIGSGSSDEVNALKGDSAVEITGYIEDIRPYVRKGAVFVAPMRKGGGLKGKLLEAMAMCKAIVTTPLGCEGLPTVPGRDLLVAMKPKEFACDVIKLLREPKLRKKLALNAYEIVRRNFDWNRVSAQLAGIYKIALNTHDKNFDERPKDF